MPQLPVSDTLSEASPDSISDLFNRDVELISDADLDRLITELRANRARYETAEAAGAKPRELKRILSEPLATKARSIVRPKLNLTPPPISKI